MEFEIDKKCSSESNVTFIFKVIERALFKVTNVEILVEKFISSPTLNTVGICSAKQIDGNSFEWRRQ